MEMHRNEGKDKYFLTFNDAALQTECLLSKGKEEQLIPFFTLLMLDVLEM